MNLTPCVRDNGSGCTPTYLNFTPVLVETTLAVLCPKPNIPPPDPGNLNPPPGFFPAGA